MVIPEGFSQVNMRYTGVAVPLGAEMTFGVWNIPEDSPTVVANKVIALWDLVLQPLFTTEVTLATVLVKNGPNDTGASAEVGSGLAGTAAPPTMTPQNSLLIRKVTVVGGRRGRGRMYQPGITEGSANASGVIAAGTLTTYQAAYNSFLTGLQADDIPMHLLHDYAKGPDGTPDPSIPIPAPFPVGSLVVDAVMATQRRRIRR